MNRHFSKEDFMLALFLRLYFYNGQQICKKIINNINHQKSANKNYNNISPYTCRDDYIKKSKGNVLARLLKNWNHFTLLVGMENCAPVVGNSIKFPQKYKNATAL